MLYLIIFIILVILILTILYIIKIFKNLSFIKKIKEKNIAEYYILISFFIIILGFLLFEDFMNTMVVMIHFVIIALLVDLMFAIFKLDKYDLIILISIVLTSIYMGFGYYSAYNIKKTTYNLKTEKETENLRIAQVTDSHIGTTFDGKGFRNNILKIMNEKPDMIVITGDYVDDSTTKVDMIEATKVFKDLNLKYGVYFIYGNHDKGLMNGRDFTADELKVELEKNNVKVLEDTSIELDDIIIVGRKDRSSGNRASAARLIDNLNNNKYIIVLDHQPNDYENLAKTSADLVLSGHTHGGQMIPLGYIGLLTGSNDQVYGLETINTTNFIVSSGISNWALKFKTGAIAEYVIIDIRSK